MAITKTERTLSMQVFFLDTSSDKPAIQLQIETTIDDPDDDDLPLRKVRDVYMRHETTDVESGETTATDVSGYEQLVQDICAAVWTDV
jgi:hypothetical protein